MSLILTLVDIPPVLAPAHPLARATATTPALADVLTATLALYQRRGHQPPWTGYLAGPTPTGPWLGTCGFAGPPLGGEVELAYFTFPPHEGRGVATRMAALLLERTRGPARDAGLRIIAHTLPAEGASTRILRGLGFACGGMVNHPEDGAVWKWGLAP